MAVVAIAGVGVALAATGGGEGAPGAVSVAGVDVDGKSRAEIADIVRARAKELATEQIVITRTDKPGFRVASTRAELHARPRVKLAVDEALEPRNVGGRILSQLGIAPTRDVEIHFTLDRGRVAALVNAGDRARQRPGPLGDPRGDRGRHRRDARPRRLRHRPGGPAGPDRGGAGGDRR